MRFTVSIHKFNNFSEYIQARVPTAEKYNITLLSSLTDKHGNVDNGSYGQRGSLTL